MTATTAAVSIYERIEQAIATILDLIQNGYICQVGLSGGKDSTIITILMLEAVRRAKLAGVVQGIHTISSSSTGVESPIVESNLLGLHDEIEAFATREDLPVTVKTVHPSLASSFVVSTIGRGTLPRFPENGAHRTCSVEWKIKPQQRLGAAIGKLAQAEGFKEVVSIIGVRFSESAARMARMNERGDSAVKPVRNADGRLVLSPIADWGLQDVWDMLELFLDPSTIPFPSFTDG